MGAKPLQTSRSMGSNASQNTDAHRALDSLRRVIRALREAARSTELRFGVSGAQFLVLHKLAEAESPISLNELARLTHTHQSSVSTVVTRLVAQRLVRRVRSERDARMVQLTLTPAGERLTSRAPDPPQNRLIEAIESLPARQQKALAEALAGVGRAVGVAKKPIVFYEEQLREKERRRRKRSGGRTRA
jgi:DNA-binding MarR family transcriptional regulator